MLKIVLFANNDMGIKLIDKFLKNSHYEVIGIVTNSHANCTSDFLAYLKVLNKTIDSEISIYEWTPELIENTDFIKLVQFSDVGLSGYFGHKIPIKLISKFKFGIVNLHPSLLPIGRGSHPIVWNVIENKKQGATIHLMDSSLDTGQILWQSEINVSISHTSEDIYKTASEILLENVTQVVSAWADGKIELISNSGEGTVHKKSDLAEVQEKNLKNVDSLENHIRWINALKFADGNRAVVQNSKGEKWKVELIMSQIEKESK
jgi:methionyl-tRNA formyltransferase